MKKPIPFHEIDRTLLRLTPRLKTKNDCELKLIARAQKAGWMVLKKGWPDFLCLKIDEKTNELVAVAVEVKRGTHDPLRSFQQLICRLLNAHGIKTYTYHAYEDELVPIELNRLTRQVLTNAAFAGPVLPTCR